MVTLLSETDGPTGGDGETARSAPVATGGPGASARREAERRRDEARRLLTEADLLERTAGGQERTAATLAWLPPGWTALHELTLPGARTPVDHLVVGPTGTFAIVSRVHEGTVRYGSGTLWTGREPLRPALQDLQHEATRLAAVLDTPVTPVMCFARGDLPRRELTLEGTRILSLVALLAFLTERPAALRTHEVERVVQEAARITRAARPLTRPARTGATAARPAEPHQAAATTETETERAAAPVAVPAGAPAGRTVRTARSARPAGAGTGAGARRPSSALRTGAAMAAVGLASYGVGAYLRHRGTAEPAGGPTIGATSITRPPAATVPVAGVAADGELAPVAAIASCVAAGAGWTVTPIWPGPTPGLAAYALSWRPSGSTAWVPARRPWTAPDQASPLAIDGIAAGGAIEVRLVAQDGSARPLASGVTVLRAPTAPC